MAETQQKQHIEFHRKITLRKGLMEKAGQLTDAFYIPFIGEGDIAVALYSDKNIYGADIDPAMVETAKSRLPKANILTADCDQFPYIDNKVTYSLADFDSYSYPYDSFRSFFKGARLASPCVLIFTDGQRQAILRTGRYRTPDGEKHHLQTMIEKRKVYNFYFNKIIVSWFNEYIKPYEVVYITKYLRKNSMCYWGAVIALPSKGSHIEESHIEKADEGGIKPYKFDSIKKASYLEHLSNGHARGYAATLVGVHRSTIADHMKADKEFARAVSEAESDAIGKIENALYEAANSGNITAIQVFLYNRDPRRWADRRNIRIGGEGGGAIPIEINAKGKLLSLLNRIAAKVKEAEDNQEAQAG